MRSCSRFQLLSIPAALEVSIPAFDTCKPWTLGLGGGWWGMYGRHMSPNLKPGSPYAPDSSKSSRLHECLNLVWNLNYPEPGPGALPGGGAPHFL